ncbi:HD-GYP domain-containing protein [Vibrio crassostreae]|uniref:HD-GYP domain-containing protein n=1 Tax=Vibrio crassostreae TaxID=246167 RepID=UPI000630CE1F|nr:HD domain-containing phosphohydrolase [Vibrio crassostreae]ROO76063.1 HD domain-containing protein [Vibrio crassostreae]ROP14073.1 HD domain-containing protein [Vibrio crassostreae]ROQ88158.1 HD domain-containing protein [Vibrio crassostreae]ROR87493.1 HD domain-containing protein [Vibrio crassostreae]ROS70973.1 HD domain-containing protein [Vibrio crassostreae]
MNQTKIDRVYTLALQHKHSLDALRLLQPMRQHSMETYEHTLRVCLLSYSFGEYLEFNEEQLELIFDSALVHDLGKLGTPGAVLHKAGKLTPVERQVMNKHVEESYSMTLEVPELELASILGSLHHERWDGNGYPLRLRGSENPLIGQVIALVDTWDAMTSTRAYRTGMPADKALRILFDERLKGQFNPLLVDKFIAFIVNTPLSEAA